VIDSTHSGKRVNDVCELPFDYPVVSTVRAAAELGAEVLILGTAPSGGRVPPEWQQPLTDCLQLGMSIVNGLHDRLNDQFGHLLSEGQWIWDVRQPSFTPKIATAQAATLDNKRVLLVGTDMAVGKMTVGLEIYRWIRDQGHDAAFLATGQIGITITGQGIPLDAFKLDHACGAVETMVMGAGNHELLFVEGQGSLLHPGSSATLSLMRGSCATHLIMCHRARMTRLRAPDSISVPPLKDFIQLNEDLATVCGSLTEARTIGVALNTSMLEDAEARAEIEKLEQEVQLPVADVVRYDPGKLGSLLV
jgi:uncharacterized NAD-dependent epimerase/dehydratase family protein